jgi:predicted transcriptional regulator
MRSNKTTAATDVTIELEPDLARRLDELSRDGGKPREQLVVEAVREYVERADPSLGTDRNVPPPKGG